MIGMLKEGKLGVHEAVVLIITAICAKVFYSSPAKVAAIVGTASWYMTLISASVAFIGFLFIYLLLKRFPGKEITEIFDISLGRFIGFIFSGILAMQTLFIAITRVAEFNEVVKVYVYQLSPNWYIVGIFIVCVFILSWLGLENIARVTKLLFYFMVAGFIIVLLLGIQNYRTIYLHPILGYGLGKTVITGIMRSSAYGEVVILAIFASSFQGVKYIKKEGIIGVIISALIISVSLFAITLTFPYFATEEITSPMYEMATLIDYGRFLQRVEPLFLFLWIISSLISATIIFYSFVWILCKMFRIGDRKPIILGGAVILFMASLMHKDIISIVHGNVQFIRETGALAMFGLPLIALIVAAIRKKGAKQNA